MPHPITAWLRFLHIHTTQRRFHSFVYAIFKVGDDLRQDCVVLQLIVAFERMWLRAGLDLPMTPYFAQPTWNNGCEPGGGFLQVVPNACTLADIQHEYGKLGAFSDKPLATWLHKMNPDPEDFKRASDLFLRSCAGYCMATYVMGVGDRHNDNIMITTFGRLFHIDFGHFLGCFKCFKGRRREVARFVFTKEMAYLIQSLVSSPLSLCFDA